MIMTAGNAVLICYEFVSTDDQNLDLPVAGSQRIYEDRMSGAKAGRPGLAQPATLGVQSKAARSISPVQSNCGLRLFGCTLDIRGNVPVLGEQVVEVGAPGEAGSIAFVTKKMRGM
jgi:hypothetical protein